jgi:glycosyltransferase involved in cell wall biosynthesis
MKDSLLLIMTPNMSLEKWNNRGQLSRELKLYSDLCEKSGLKLIIFSYGRNDLSFISNYPLFTVLNMPSWIPSKIPFRIQNVIYHLISLFCYRSYFKRSLLAKTNQFRAAEFGLLLNMFYSIPLIIRMGFYYSHFKKISPFMKMKEKIAFSKADLIITTSSEAASFIEKEYQIDSGKLLFMCNSVDLTRFKPLDIPKEFDIIFVGKLEHQKNINLLLEVIKDINCKTLIIGKGSLKKEVLNAMQNSTNLTWLERVDNKDLPMYYNKSKCFILPSNYEGNPKVLLEAMACALPCIITEVPGIRECIQENVTGIYINTDIATSRHKIMNLLADEIKSKQMGRNALAWVDEQGNASKNIDREIEAYQKMLFGSRSDNSQLLTAIGQ